MTGILPFAQLSGSLSPNAQLSGSLSANARVYNGPTEFIPTDEDQIAHVGGCFTPRNLIFRAIPYREVDNEAGGRTAYIGGGQS